MKVRSLLPLGLLLIAGAQTSAEEPKPKAIFRQGKDTDYPSLVYSPDGKMLAVAVHPLGTTSRLLKEAPGFILDLLFKRNPPLKNGTAKLLDAASGKEMASLSVPGECSSVAFRPDGKMLAVGGQYRVRLWSLGRGKPTEQDTVGLSEEMPSDVSSMAFSPDGKKLALTCKTVMVWNLESKKWSDLIAKDGIHYVLFSPDGKTLVTQSVYLPKVPIEKWDKSYWDKLKFEIKVWDVASEKEKATLETAFKGGGALGFTPDSKLLAYAVRVPDEKGGEDLRRQVKLWNLSTKKEEGTFKGHHGGASTLAFTADGKLLAVGCGSGTVKVWDVATTKEIATLSGPSGAVNVVTFSPDGKTLAASYAGRAEIRLWDVPQLLRQKKDK